MARFSKIRSIYLKELLETMRDKRTLLAMFVVPALLYPLMMLGVAKIQLREQTALETAEYTVAVQSREHALLLREMLSAKRESELREAIEAARDGPDTGVLLLRPTTFPEFDVMSSASKARSSIARPTSILTRRPVTCANCLRGAASISWAAR